MDDHPGVVDEHVDLAGPRDEYLLTEAGAELGPVIGALRRWGERWVTPGRAAPGDGERRRGA